MTEIEFRYDTFGGGVFVQNVKITKIPDGTEQKIINAVKSTCAECRKCSGAESLLDLNTTGLLLKGDTKFVRIPDCPLLITRYKIED